MKLTGGPHCGPRRPARQRGRRGQRGELEWEGVFGQAGGAGVTACPRNTADHLPRTRIAIFPNLVIS